MAGPVEAARLLAHLEGIQDWPPPGLRVVPVGHPEVWALLVEESAGSAPDDGMTYWTTLSNFLTALDDQAVQVLAQLASRFVGPIAVAVADIGQWPVTWRAETGETMRWLSATIRGELGGGVEQFQHKFDFGNPGADPDIDEAAGLALAEQLAGLWKSAITTNTAGGDNLLNIMGNGVVYTEVGITQKTQTDGTAADGSGGNLSQDFDTQWFAWLTADRPAKNTGGVLPFEVSCAVTLLTDKRGPSGRGRAYLPPFTPSMVGVDGLYTAAVAIAGQAVGNFFDQVKGATPYVPVVVSRRRIVLNEINTVTVGRVPDSQRRRRRSQDEAYITAWPAA